MDKEHKNREQTNLLDLEMLAPNCSKDLDNWEPLRKSEGAETVLEDSGTDEDCALPVSSVPGLSSPEVPLPAASRCSWWPFCMSDTFICNGTQKSLCTVYGVRHHQSQPSHVQLFVLIS